MTPKYEITEILLRILRGLSWLVLGGGLLLSFLRSATYSRDLPPSLFLSLAGSAFATILLTTAMLIMIDILHAIEAGNRQQAEQEKRRSATGTGK